ncbi:MAG TPA: MATE family efflux transporter [Lacipirellulaceae bacterium]|nr:MATE family efflux transporter [Lacipirellulaceae bacterium]
MSTNTAAKSAKPSRSKRSLTDGSIVGALVRLSIPIVLANILQTAYQITDTFWVGRLSTEAVAAVTLCFPINFLMIAIGGGLPIAGSVLIAQYKGRGEMRRMNHIAGQTLLVVLSISVVLSGLGYWASDPIIRMMTSDPTVIPDAVRFLQITFIGFVFVFGFFVYQSLTRGLGVVQVPMLIVLLTVLLNFGLDPLFIFGWGRLPPMGVSGAAMATLCTQALAAAIGFALLFSGQHGLRPRLADFRPDLSLLNRIIRLGIPASVEQSMRALALTVMTFLVATFGTVAIAAYGVGIRILTFVIIPAMGLAMATSTIVGQNIGAGKMERAERTNTVACILAFGLPTLAGCLLYILAVPLSRLFVPDEPATIAESARFIHIMSLTIGCIGFQNVINGTLRGAGNTLAAMVLSIVAVWVIQFPLAYVLSKHTSLGIDGIWWAYPVSMVTSATISLLWFISGDWKRTKLVEEVELEERVREEVRIDEGIPS